MGIFKRWLREHAASASHDEGSVTVELAMWTPAVLIGFATIADIAFIYNGQALATQVLEDANRKLSVGQLATEQAAMDYIETRLAGTSPNAVANTDVHAGVVTSTVLLPIPDLAAVGWFISWIAPVEMEVKSQQYVELVGRF